MDEKAKEQIDILEKELTRLASWIQTVESRIGLILPLSTAMLGALAVLSPSHSNWTVFPAIAAAFAVLFLALSILFSAFASFPRMSGPKGSLIYFNGISAMERDQYIKAMKGLTEDDYIEDLINQCHRNAQIAKCKFSWIQKALACLFLSSAPWALSVYLLYSARP